VIFGDSMDADARSQNAAVRSDQPLPGDQKKDLVPEVIRPDGLDDVVAEDLGLANEPVLHQDAAIQHRPVPSPTSIDEEKDHHWLVNYHRNESRYLHTRTEELEHEVRRRTIMLRVAVVVAVLSAVTTVGTVIVHLTESPSADQVRAAVSPPQAQPDPSPTAQNSGRRLSSEPPIIPPASSGAASVAAAGPTEVSPVGDNGNQDIQVRDQQIAALEHDLAEARHTAGQARDEADQLARQVQQLTGARAGLEQRLAQGSQATTQAAQELEARAEHIAVLERDAALAEQNLAQRTGEIDRLTSELRSVAEERDKLQTYAAERTRLLEQAGQNMRAGADRVQALEHELSLAKQQIGSAQQQFDERRAALEQQLASMAETRNEAAKALEARDQRIASLESELVIARKAAERGREKAQQLTTEMRDMAEAGSTATWDGLRLTAPEPAPSDAIDGWRRTLLTSDIFIVPGSDRLAARASTPLAEAAQLIRQSTGAVRIIGHMDDTGDADANRRLSLRRAQAVRDYLVSSYGFDPTRFTVEGKGSDEPVAPNNTASGRHANRRVELLIAG
jgi:outer membrane protein OmpA-like peptidoglycan-associated protein